MTVSGSVRHVMGDQRSAWLLVVNVVCTAVVVTALIYSLLPPRAPPLTLSLGAGPALTARYKGASINPDGTVDVVFTVPRVPKGLDAGDPVLTPVTPGPPAPPPTPRVSVRTKYPLTLFTDVLINPQSLCPAGHTVHYIVLVHSATAYFERRRAIRETFGAKRLFGHVTQRVAFLMGTTSDKDTTRQIRAEAVEFGDIVQGPFVDSYHNLTHKGVMGLRWVSEFCPQAEVIIKIDDDVFLNVFRIVDHILPEFRNSTRKISCHLRRRGTSPIVRGEGKWQVKEHEFKELKSFPFDYCNGYCVFMSRDLIRPMVNAARVNPFFWIDDVYLFGMLPATVGGARFTDMRANMTLSHDNGRGCLDKDGLACRYVAISQWRTGGDDALWYKMAANLTHVRRTELHLFELS